MTPSSLSDKAVFLARARFSGLVVTVGPGMKKGSIFPVTVMSKGGGVFSFPCPHLPTALSRLAHLPLGDDPPRLSLIVIWKCPGAHGGVGRVATNVVDSSLEFAAHTAVVSAYHRCGWIHIHCSQHLGRGADALLIPSTECVVWPHVRPAQRYSTPIRSFTDRFHRLKFTCSANGQD